MSVITQRREFIFGYDIRNGNPNGDTDDNKPRRFPNGQVHTSYDRQKRYVRDQRALEGANILVAKQDGETVTIKAVVGEYAERYKKEHPNIKKLEGRQAVQAICEGFEDARIFGNSLAVPGFKFVPKSLHGPVQIQPAIALHDTETVHQQGYTVMGGGEDKETGTTTNRFYLRYAFLVAHGILNEANAAITGMTDEDYANFLRAWRLGLQNCNTHSKMCQVPRLVVSITNKEGNQHQFGNLLDYVVLRATNGIGERQWTSPADFKLDLSILIKRIGQYAHCIEKVEYDIHPDMQLTVPIPKDWEFMNLDEFPPKVLKEIVSQVTEAR